MTIGQRVRTRREELGMTQEELAHRIGYKSRSSINKIELDGRNLTQQKLKLIADALQTTPGYIMGWVDEVEIEAEKSHPEEDTMSRLMAYYTKLRPDGQQVVDDLIQSLLRNDHPEE